MFQEIYIYTAERVFIIKRNNNNNNNFHIRGKNY